MASNKTCMDINNNNESTRKVEEFKLTYVDKYGDEVTIEGNGIEIVRFIMDNEFALRTKRYQG